MPIIPILRCSRMASSLALYTGALGFEVEGGRAEGDDPSFVILRREGARLALSSHPGDGEFGQAVMVLTDDVDGLFAALRERGLRLAARAGSPVHERPTDQSWGAREFYVDDPDGNTLRFTQFGPGDGSDRRST